ncbi:MAG: NAD(P)/FAD-dependent oxidoreductase [Merismopedia sp. SIO2A8]|nr:NAD(P)/FAD-dependent oxidoreductase [Merismopedia sp. SIO2A8]
MTQDTQTDVIVIGSGIGGLSCASLLAQHGVKVIVCESHSIPGGAAHGFNRHGFTFDSGPSLFSGLSYSPSTNPLRQVLDAIDEDIEWLTYNRWGCCLPEGDFDTTVGADQFCQVLQRLRGDAAVVEWRQLQAVMAPLQAAAIALPPAAMRFDWGVVRTMAPFLPQMVRQLPRIAQLTGPFSQLMDGVVTDPFIRNWLDLLCFLLSGLPAEGTIAAEMAFMFGEWYRPGVVLDYPKGGSEAIVGALVRGLTRHGGTLRLNAHVQTILVEGTGTQKRAAGVRLADGSKLHASHAVISNASVWDTLRLLPEGAIPPKFVQQRQATPECASFMHLHLGIDATGLPSNVAPDLAPDLVSDLACHYIVVNDWEKGVTAPQNVVLISIPSLLDPSLAPAGHHTIQVYTPGNEPYDLWQDMDRRSPEYKALKRDRAQVMWHALERVIPDVRSRCQVALEGTPLTHERFLRRHQGSYGPAIQAGSGIFPGPKTPLPGLLCCGDSTFPGIGLPAVAASGMIAAHSITPVSKQMERLQQIGIVP